MRQLLPANAMAAVTATGLAVAPASAQSASIDRLTQRECGDPREFCQDYRGTNSAAVRRCAREQNREARRDCHEDRREDRAEFQRKYRGTGSAAMPRCIRDELRLPTPCPMPRILIAEDEPRLAAFLEKGLAASGYATTTAHDGPAALSMARDETFDLVLLDIGLPGIDGLEVLRELRRRGERLPVIIITAADEIEAHGADDFLSKPFRFAELLTRVRAQLR